LPGSVYLMDELATLYGVDPEVTAVLDMFEVHTIPVLNPDGYEYSQTVSNNWRLSRKPNPGSNAIGTDLNRNFNYGIAFSFTSCCLNVSFFLPQCVPRCGAFFDAEQPFCMTHPLLYRLGRRWFEWNARILHVPRSSAAR
jgi:hypothetical protein